MQMWEFHKKRNTMSTEKRGGLKSYDVLQTYIKHLENHVIVIDNIRTDIIKYHDEVEDANAWNDVHHTAFGMIVNDIADQLKEGSDLLQSTGVENLKKLLSLYQGIGLK